LGAAPDNCIERKRIASTSQAASITGDKLRASGYSYLPQVRKRSSVKACNQAVRVIVGILANRFKTGKRRKYALNTKDSTFFATEKHSVLLHTVVCDGQAVTGYLIKEFAREHLRAIRVHLDLFGDATQRVSMMETPITCIAQQTVVMAGWLFDVHMTSSGPLAVNMLGMVTLHHQTITDLQWVEGDYLLGTCEGAGCQREVVYQPLTDSWYLVAVATYAEEGYSLLSSGSARILPPEERARMTK
jgi:hypothetical protein